MKAVRVTAEQDRTLNIVPLALPTAIEVFRAGDICLTEDRTGEGHLNRIRGAMHVTNLVIETEDLWPYKPER